MRALASMRRAMKRRSGGVRGQTELHCRHLRERTATHADHHREADRHKDGAIGWITFNNPQKRNAVSLEMHQALALVLEEFARDASIRVVILKGAGDKAFVSGADIAEFKEKRATLEAIKVFDVTSNRAAKALRECPKPTIAMIRGYCMGGGLGTAVACDLRIAFDESRFV